MLALTDRITRAFQRNVNCVISPTEARKYVHALRSAARTGPDVAVKPLEWVVTSPGATWVATTTTSRYFIYYYEDANIFITFLEGKPDSRASGLATLESAKAVIEPSASSYTREFKHAEELANELLSTFTITRKEPRS
jgi:hypothetical protein